MPILKIKNDSNYTLKEINNHINIYINDDIHIYFNKEITIKTNLKFVIPAGYEIEFHTPLRQVIYNYELIGDDLKELVIYIKNLNHSVFFRDDERVGAGDDLKQNIYLKKGALLGYIKLKEIISIELEYI